MGPFGYCIPFRPNKCHFNDISTLNIWSRCMKTCDFGIDGFGSLTIIHYRKIACRKLTDQQWQNNRKLITKVKSFYLSRHMHLLLTLIWFKCDNRIDECCHSILQYKSVRPMPIIILRITNNAYCFNWLRQWRRCM